MNDIEKEIKIAICAQAGQGVETVQDILLKISKKHNYYASSVKDYQSRIRGGINCTTIRLSEDVKNGFHSGIDILMALTKGSVEHLKERIHKNTVVICDKNITTEGVEVGASIEIDFGALATEVGNKITANTVAVGVICGLVNFGEALAEEIIRQNFSDETIIQINLEALKKGRTKGQEIKNSIGLNIKIERKDEVKEKLLLTGNSGLGLGCIAGGCDFISYYPMTPGAGLYEFLSHADKSLNIIAEQCEDEIAVINMAIGAWYSGARAMITTSGGGFALMCEAVSLAGILESPMVIHVAQRPGPATGLPTRTEQADLELVLYSGHGEFPRVVFAPSTPENAFKIGALAFEYADKFQVPVFIVSDQYLIDSYFTSDTFKLPENQPQNYIVETAPEYKRYQITDNGISPRGVPAFGSGFVCVDSDEHNEVGEIEENPINRKNMVDKRLRKMNEIKKEILQSEFFGDENYHTLLISWGATYSTVKEVIDRLSGVAMLHFTQLHPLPDNISDYLQENKKIISIENNATGQFAKLIKLQTGYDIKHKILQYNGYPFNVEDLIKAVEATINE